MITVIIIFQQAIQAIRVDEIDALKILKHSGLEGFF